MNSLMDEANELDSKLSEIKLSITHPQNSNKIFILLEGKTDIKLFRNIFSYIYTDTTEVKGKDNVIQALETLITEGYSKIIGISDADFDHLEETTYHNNLFVTDYHDTEVQMIESNALNSLINEFTLHECHQNFLSNLKNTIYTIAIEIGYIRWYSAKNSGLLNFKSIRWNTLVTYENCHISFNKNELLARLSEQLEETELNINDINILKEFSTDKLQICNGHDLTMLISNYFPIGNINQNKIEEALRLSYTIEYFQTTNLFNNLQSWSSANDYRLFD